MSKIKITNHQMGVLTAGFTCGTTILFVSANVAAMAKQDAWISSVIAIVLGVPFVFLIVYLGCMHPEKTYIEIMQTAMGKRIGGFAAANFIFFCLVDASQVTSYINDFMTTQFMPETPSYAVAFIFVASLAIAVLYGIEPIVRSAEILIYVVSLMFLGAMALDLKNIEFSNLLPMLENGIVPPLKGAVQLSGFITWP